MNLPDEQALPPVAEECGSRSSNRQSAPGVYTRDVSKRAMYPEQGAIGSMKSAADIVFARSPQVLRRSVAVQNLQAVPQAKLDAAVAENA